MSAKATETGNIGVRGAPLLLKPLALALKSVGGGVDRSSYESFSAPSMTGRIYDLQDKQCGRGG
jgi:hypothetical protein